VALIAAAASVPYLNSLNGKYCYDDKVSCSGRRDLLDPTSARALRMWQMSLRLMNGAITWGGYCIQAPQGAETFGFASSLVQPFPLSALQVAVAGNPDVYKKEVTFHELITHDFWGNDMLNRRGYGWTHHSWRPLIVMTFRWDHALGQGSPFPFHLSNVIYHALSALAAYLTYRVLFPPVRYVAGQLAGIDGDGSRSSSGEPKRRISARALLAAILFAVHPVHSECVANITSRADAVASIFQLLAIALYIAASGRIGEEIKDAFLQKTFEEEQLTAEERRKRSGCGAILKGMVCPCLRQGRPSDSQANSSRCRRYTTTGFRVFSAMLGYFALLLISLACKETSLVVPFLCVSYDIAVAMARAAVSSAPSASQKSSSSNTNWLSLSLHYLRRLFFFELPLLKAVLVFAFGYGVYYVRIQIVAKGYNLESWANPIHNSLYHTKDRLERVLSIALVQAFALSKLVFPLWLSHEHNAFKHVHGFFEARNTLTVVIWIGLAVVVAVALLSLWRAMMVASKRRQEEKTAEAPLQLPDAKEDVAAVKKDKSALVVTSNDDDDAPYYLIRAFSVLYGLAWVVVSYFPSSHAVQYVAFILAERTLYLPSFGAAIILAELIGVIGGRRRKQEQAAVATGAVGAIEDEPAGAALPWNNDSLTVETGSNASDPTAASHDGDASAAPPSRSSNGARSGSATPSKGSNQSQGGGSGGATPTKEKRTRFVFGYKIKLPGKTNSASAAYQQKVEQQQQQLQQKDAAAVAVTAGEAETVKRPISASPSSSSRFRSPVFHSLVGTRRRTLATLITSLLLCWYFIRTYTRNWDWVNEEELMSANLHHYPDGNVMTIYGLGAVALYKGEIDKSEQFLVRACNESSMVEPHILLSQLYWKHRVNDIGEKALDIAISELEHVASTVTPRKEVLTNLGMLLFKRADRNDTVALKQAEYYILAAQVAHGYPEGHHSIAQLSSNAGCIRLMSTKDRYGDAQAAERLVNEALEVARNSGGTGAAFKNAATFYAVQGYAPHASSILEEGIGYVEQGLKQALESTDPVWPGSRSTVLQYYQELLYNMQRQMISIQLHAPLMAAWAASGPPVVGEEAEPRMSILGVECMLELLWW
jgi:hypothetical protein